MNIDQLSRFQALDLMSQISKAAEKQQWGTVMYLSGLTDELVNGMSVEEALEYASVRIAQIARKAGLDVK